MWSFVKRVMLNVVMLKDFKFWNTVKATPKLSFFNVAVKDPSESSSFAGKATITFGYILLDSSLFITYILRLYIFPERTLRIYSSHVNLCLIVNVS